MKDQLRVAILTGGLSAEDYLSRRSGELFLAHADPRRYICSLFNWNIAGWVDESAPGDHGRVIARHPSVLAAFAAPGRFDLVLNALHGEWECDAQIQGLLELARLPYTGNNRMSSVLGMNKILSKKVFREAGLPTADWISFTWLDRERHDALVAEAVSRYGFPLILKAACGGSSNSTRLIDDESQLRAELQRFLKVYGEAYIEPYLEGLEYTVGVFGDGLSKPLLTLPIARIKYEGKIFDAKIKHDDTYQVVIPCGLAEEDMEELRQASIAIHLAMRFEAFCRVDFRYSKGKPYLLEVNTHPGFSSHSIVPTMLKAAGIPWSSAIDMLVEAALKRPVR